MRVAFVQLVALVFAAPALAAAGGDEGGGSLTFFWQVVNFALLLFALVYFGRKPITSYFRDRRETIMTQLSEAADLQREAEEKYARWQRQLVDLESEVGRIQNNARDRAEREATQILADAQASAERIKRDAAATIDQELRRAQDRLRAETAELAVELAAGILREQVTDQDRSRLLDEFIGRIEETTGSGPNGGLS